jgi:hypothetical protein
MPLCQRLLTHKCTGNLLWLLNKLALSDAPQFGRVVDECVHVYRYRFWDPARSNVREFRFGVILS